MVYNLIILSIGLVICLIILYSERITFIIELKIFRFGLYLMNITKNYSSDNNLNSNFKV